MNEKTLDLFNENYTNKGICKDLPKYLKTFEKEYKKSNVSKKISYYPWAVAERLFRMQGGKLSVVDWASKVSFSYTDYAPNENGELVMTTQEQHALFIHLKATWQDLEEEEFYPIFDNQSSKIIKTPNALDLNTAKQRGMVRLIARISGIGLDIFEQTELQEEVFQEMAETTSIKVEKKTIEPKVEKPKVQAMSVPITPPLNTKNEPEQPEQDFIKSFLSGDEIEPKKEIKKEKDLVYGNDTQEYADLLLEVRKYIRDNGFQNQAKAFVMSKEKELLSELSYDELKNMKGSLK
jgi:hypothetical protein